MNTERTRFPSLERGHKPVNYNLRRATAVVALAGTLFGASKGIEWAVDAFSYNHVADQTASLSNGETVIQLTSEMLGVIAQENGINPNSLPSGVKEAQNAATESKVINGGEKYNQPGEQFVVDVDKNNFGYKVTVEPATTTNLG